MTLFYRTATINAPKKVSRFYLMSKKASPFGSPALTLEQALRLEVDMLTPERPRLERDDGDQVPLFASPEGTQPWMDRGSEDLAAEFSRTQSPRSDAIDAATDLLEGLIDDLSTTEASDLMREEESVDEDHKKGEEYVFNDLGEAASFNTARPPDPYEVSDLARQIY